MAHHHHHHVGTGSNDDDDKSPGYPNWELVYTARLQVDKLAAALE